MPPRGWKMGSIKYECNMCLPMVTSLLPSMPMAMRISSCALKYLFDVLLLMMTSFLGSLDLTRARSVCFYFQLDVLTRWTAVFAGIKEWLCWLFCSYVDNWSLRFLWSKLKSGNFQWDIFPSHSFVTVYECLLLLLFVSSESRNCCVVVRLFIRLLSAEPWSSPLSMERYSEWI